jgi:hypothetical protein
MTSDASTTTDDQTTDDQDDATTTDGQDDTTDWKAEARKWETRAKNDQKRARDLEKQQRESMTDAQRALAEAESKGRTAAVTEFGTRLVRTEFDAAAGRRNPDFDTASALEYVDLSKFVGDDGEPDTKAIKAAVERLVPEPLGGTPSYDGGSRSTSKGPTDMNQVIRKAAGRA